jgi:hypothetical protein
MRYCVSIHRCRRVECCARTFRAEQIYKGERKGNAYTDDDDELGFATHVLRGDVVYVRGYANVKARRGIWAARTSSPASAGTARARKRMAAT